MECDLLESLMPALHFSANDPIIMIGTVFNGGHVARNCFG